MKEFTLYLLLLSCLITQNLSATAQSNSDTVSIGTSFQTKSDTIIVNSVNSDSILYVNRLDSLKSEIPLIYNPQVKKYIGIYTGSRKIEFSNMLELSQYYFPIFEKALKAYNLPDAFKYLPVIESAIDCAEAFVPTKVKQERRSR